MNRRSLFKAAIGACAAMLVPWRAAVAAKNDKVDQVERIKRLLKYTSPGPNKPMSSVTAVKVRKGRRWRPWVQSLESDSCSIEIWWDEEEPDDAGRYGCGLVMLKESLAASLDDKTLAGHLCDAFLMAITGGNAARLALIELDLKFKGRAVYMTFNKQRGVFVTIKTPGDLSET